MTLTRTNSIRKKPDNHFELKIFRILWIIFWLIIRGKTNFHLQNSFDIKSVLSLLQRSKLGHLRLSQILRSFWGENRAIVAWNAEKFASRRNHFPVFRNKFKIIFEKWKLPAARATANRWFSKKFSDNQNKRSEYTQILTWKRIFFSLL